MRQLWRQISYFCRLQPARFMVLCTVLASPIMGWIQAPAGTAGPAAIAVATATVPPTRPFMPTPWPTSTPRPPIDTRPLPLPHTGEITGETEQELFVVRPMPTSTSTSLSSPPPIKFEVVVYQDHNLSGEIDRQEGIPQLSVQVSAGGKLIGWGITDQDGRIQFVLNQAPDTLAIPYLNWQQTVWGSTELITIRLSDEGAE